MTAILPPPVAPPGPGTEAGPRSPVSERVDRAPRRLRPGAADRAVRRWLVATALCVTAAIAVGGITRLTESGLSITEWKPVSGILPPIGEAAWADAYGRYQRIPEARTVHAGITLAAFKRLYWWEWLHRNLARTVGLIIVVPYLVLLVRRRVRPSLHLRLAHIPLLTALQAGVGWYMVRSGLSGRTSVSPYRLVLHLGIALVILAIAVWSATAIGRVRPARERPGAGTRAALVALAALAGLTMLSGGIVAGLDAGRIFNTFPLMGGTLVPSGYGLLPGWHNIFENPVAAQFHHRLLATVTATATVLAWVASSRALPRSLRAWLRLAAAAALAQVLLGIGTLLLAVPIPLAVAHQFGGVVLLVALVGGAADARLAPWFHPADLGYVAEG